MHTISQDRTQKMIGVVKFTAFIVLLCLYRKSIMTSTGAISLARRGHWTPPSFQCIFPLMLNHWVRYSWAPLAPGEQVCSLPTGLETCHTMVRLSLKKETDLTLIRFTTSVMSPILLQMMKDQVPENERL